MEKNNLINEEIDRIKSIMGINEQVSPQVKNCINVLHQQGYTVVSKTDREASEAVCLDKPRIKCVMDYLTAKGVDDNKWEVRKWNNNECFLIINGGTRRPGGQWGRNLIFWENGKMSYIGTFDPLQDLNDNNGIFLFTAQQYQFDGTFTCNGNDLKHQNFHYQALYDKNVKEENAQPFTQVDKNGAKLSFKMGEYFTKSGVAKNDDTWKIIKKF